MKIVFTPRRDFCHSLIQRQTLPQLSSWLLGRPARSVIIYSAVEARGLTEDQDLIVLSAVQSHSKRQSLLQRASKFTLDKG